MRVYGEPDPGNCLKVKDTADHLGLPYQWVPVDIMAGERRTPAFLANGFDLTPRIPVRSWTGRCEQALGLTIH